MRLTLVYSYNTWICATTFPLLLAFLKNTKTETTASLYDATPANLRRIHGQVDAGLATCEALFRREPDDHLARDLLLQFRRRKRFDQHAALFPELKAKTDVLAPPLRRDIVRAPKEQGRYQELLVLEQREYNDFPADHLVGANNLVWLYFPRRCDSVD